MKCRGARRWKRVAYLEISFGQRELSLFEAGEIDRAIGASLELYFAGIATCVRNFSGGLILDPHREADVAGRDNGAAN